MLQFIRDVYVEQAFSAGRPVLFWRSRWRPVGLVMV